MGGWEYHGFVTTATPPTKRTLPLWARLAVAVVPVIIVVKLLDRAWFQYGRFDFTWFQYGVDGLIFAQPESVQMVFISGYYFREPWIGVVAAATAVATLPLWLFLGYRLVVDGSRRAVYWYLGSSCVVCTALLFVGSNIVALSF